MQKKLTSDFSKEKINPCNSIKFLGITFDTGFNFNDHILDIKKKCNNMLNLIKILSNKKQKQTIKALKIIYLSLIRSILDYSSLIVNQVSKKLSKINPKYTKIQHLNVYYSYFIYFCFSFIFLTIIYIFTYKCSLLILINLVRSAR
jgi:hypothetical protein